MSTQNIHIKYRTQKRYPTIISIVPPGLALIVTFGGSNYRCLEQIFMVPKGFEPLFDCKWITHHPSNFFFFFVSVHFFFLEFCFYAFSQAIWWYARKCGLWSDCSCKNLLILVGTLHMCHLIRKKRQILYFAVASNSFADSNVPSQTSYMTFVCIV